VWPTSKGVPRWTAGVATAWALLTAGAGTARADPAGAVGGLLVAPTRVVFEGNRRSAALTLINTGSETATYRIAFIQMKMTPDGQIIQVPDDSAGAFRSDHLIRYSPRQVTLKPHMPQTVRLQLRLPAELPDGEYRSHLLFRAIPEPNAAPDETPGEPPAPDKPALAAASLVPGGKSPAPPPAASKSSKKKRGSREPPGVVAIQMTSVFGVAVPVIVRHGETSAIARLSTLSVHGGGAADGARKLSLIIERDGNQSVYGNLVVTHVDAAGHPVIVGRLDGLAVYTSAPRRRVEIPLTAAPGHALGAGRLRVSYAAAGGADEPLATAEIALH
jgi:hypothetical protein